MLRSEKIQEVGSLRESLGQAEFAVLAGFQGLTANQMSTLRARLRGSEARLRVVKNRLARLAIAGTPLALLKDHFKGPVGVIWGQDGPSSAKVLTAFVKEVEALRIKGGVLGGEVLDRAAIEALSALPTREVLLAQLLGLFNAPAQNFVSLLAAVPRGFLTVLKGYHDQRIQGGG